MSEKIYNDRRNIFLYVIARGFLNYLDENKKIEFLIKAGYGVFEKNLTEIVFPIKDAKDSIYI